MKKTIEHLENQIMNLTHDVYSKREVEMMLQASIEKANQEKAEDRESEDFTDYTDRVAINLGSSAFSDEVELSITGRNEIEVEFDIRNVVRSVLDELNSVWEG